MQNNEIIGAIPAEIISHSYLHEVMHKHRGLDICFMLSASCVLITEGEEIPVSDECLTVIAPETLHKTMSDNPISFIKFHGCNAVFSELDTDEKNTRFSCVIKNNKIISIARLAERELKEKKPFYEERLGAIRDELIIELLRNHTVSPETAAKITREQQNIVITVNEYLQSHFKEKLSLDEIANFAGFNKSYLSRTYRKVTGSTIWQYIGILRCEYAKNLIPNSQMTMEQICVSCGFDTPSHFRKTFKEYTGLTPSEFKKASHKSES